MKADESSASRTEVVTEGGTGPEFLKRTALAALVTGIVAGAAIVYRWGWPAGSGFVTALVWGLANFAVLALILRAAARPGGGDRGRLAALVVLKLVGLYGLALLILWKRWFPIPAFLAGFSWPLLIVLLRALGGMWWGRARTA